MSKQFLQRVAAGPLPYVAFSVTEIDQVAVMRAAGLISALVPQRVGDRYEETATVLRVTDAGRSYLQGAWSDEGDLLAWAGR